MVAAHAYEADTVVIDVEEELVHVLHNGEWHRRSPDLATTACGEPLHSQFAPLRPFEVSHRDAPLARRCGCHTPAELAKADQRDRERFEP